MSKTVIFNLFIDDELVGDGAALLTQDNRVRGGGGPMGYINMVFMAPFEGLFPGYVRTEDTGTTKPWGDDGEVAKIVNVYTLSEKKWNNWVRGKLGGSSPEVLPF